MQNINIITFSNKLLTFAESRFQHIKYYTTTVYYKKNIGFFYNIDAVHDFALIIAEA